MPFLRFSRDKRGYEHICLVHSSTRRGRPSRSRVLYWYRTPPGIRVGREPFDEGARRLLEAQYPDLAFDWEAIAATPMPPAPEIEPWRERRRAQRAARRPAEEADSQVVDEPIEAVEPEKAVEALSASVDQAPAEAHEPISPPRRRRRGGRRRPRSSPAEPAAPSIGAPPAEEPDDDDHAD